MKARTLRQLLLLGVLLIVLGGVLWWNFGGMTGAGSPPAASRQAARAGAPQAGQAPAVEDVALESLEASAPEPADSDRNPFRFGGRRLAAEPQPFGARGPGGAGGQGGPQAQAPPAPAGPPPIPMRFFGIVEDHGRKLAALTDGRGNVFYGSEGDIIEGRYRIVRIGVESIELAWVDGRGQQTIRLSGS